MEQPASNFFVTIKHFAGSSTKNTKPVLFRQEFHQTDYYTNMFNGSVDVESESATSLKFCKIQGNFAQLWRKLRYFFSAANLRQKFVHSGPAGIAATVRCSIIV